MLGARPIDLLIIGGGLAGGLIALAMRARHPEQRTVLVEGAERAGGNHVWSCFAGDVVPQDRWIIEPLISQSWAGHQVRFESHRRDLSGSYASLTGERLDAALRASLPPGDLLTGTRVSALSSGSATLADGQVLDARAVIDARGPGDMSALRLGWQKFLGITLALDRAHHLAGPIIMDATVDQTEGYRFVYTLPFTADSLFIEDTYYSDTPDLDEPELTRRIMAYAAAQGWQGKPTNHRETGVLPVCKGGDFEAYWAASAPGVGKAGLRGGFFHAMTGYSLPDSVRIANLVTAMDHPRGAELHDALLDAARRHWRGQAFYRMLATMLFDAAAPADRHHILDRFYTLDSKLIGRFYAGRTTLYDKARILIGKPPVPISGAIAALGATHL
jgi:lycopene beta-cyclase